MGVNPLFFKPPRSTRNWASRTVLGERIWVDRDELGSRRSRVLLARPLAARQCLLGNRARLPRLRAGRPEPARDRRRPSDHPRRQGLVSRSRLAAVRGDEGPQGRVRVLGLLEERLALAPVGRDLVDDPLALDQVERVEALAELAGLRVAQVDTVADPQLVGGRAGDRGLDLPRTLITVEAKPAWQVGIGEAVPRLRLPRPGSRRRAASRPRRPGGGRPRD